VWLLLSAGIVVRAHACRSDGTAFMTFDEAAMVVPAFARRGGPALLASRKAWDRLILPGGRSILLDRETIDRSQFLKLLDGVPEDEIWVAEVTQDSTPETPASTPERSSGRPRIPGFPLPAPPDAPPAGA
jgi:hypothetical protein